MRARRKALCLGVLTVIAASALGTAGVSATTGGHFSLEADHLILKGTEGGPEFHRTESLIFGLRPINCKNTSYEGTALSATTTVESIKVIPTYQECETTSEHKFAIDTNGCGFVLKVTGSGTGESTIDVDCPAGKEIVYTDPICTMKVPPQTGRTGITYTQIIKNERHALTIDFHVVDLTSHFEGGPCVLFGTTFASGFLGSVVLSGFDTEGKPLGITATGSKG